MLISLGHGKRIVVHKKALSTEDAGLESVAASKVFYESKLPEYSAPGDCHGPQDPDPQPTPDPGSMMPHEAFRYLVPGTDPIPEVEDAAAKLDALADAMAEAANDQADEVHESKIPPIMTYLGQFIDHDITANTDREESDAMLERFNIDKTSIAPQPRADVEQFKTNLRKGNLGLDSVYGDGPGQSDMVSKLEQALRDPADPAKMRLGSVFQLNGFDRTPLPADEGADLPRIGQIIDEGVISLEEARDMFGDPDNPPDLSDAEAVRNLKLMPLIGDSRNDENLIVAQTHLAFLRFHNAVVDAIRADLATPADDEALFAAAREQVTWIYQWLVTNVFLKSVCDPDIVDQVVADRAPVYQDFFDAHQGAMPQGVRPMPLEFSVATFRYGHSMVRGEYDYNSNFGRKADGSDNTAAPRKNRASFMDMFEFTGSGGMRGLNRLPDNWIIDWPRFIGETSLSNRVARKIDTELALPLKTMRNASPGASGIMNHLAARNLRRGYVFNLPDAQSLHAGLVAAGADLGDPLTTCELTSGATGDAVEAGGFETSTPLWFYILKEAEVRADGEHLGPLGSRIVAETIVGLMATDPTSYLFAGSSFNSWTPEDATKPNGEAITSLGAMLRAAGVLGALTS